MHSVEPKLTLSRWRARLAVVLSVVILTGPWWLAGLSRWHPLAGIAVGAYKRVYSPLFALLAPYGRAIEDQALALASPSMRQDVVRGRPFLVDPTLTTLGRLLQAFGVVILGGSIGSFLNVVVYRLPRGMGLLRPASRCPHCEYPILARDNIPVIGWLVLRGRCRRCQIRISARYPIVEAAVAGLVFMLALLELHYRGVNLPQSGGPSVRAFAHVAPIHVWICGYHAFLLCAILAAALMDLDGYAPPFRFVVVALFVVLATPALRPEIRPVAAISTAATGEVLPVPIAVAFDGALGLLGGYGLGCVLSAVRADSVRAAHTDPTIVFVMSMIGSGLGWQAAAAVAAVVALLAAGVCLVNLVRRNAMASPTSLLASAVAIGHVLTWRWLLALAWWPGRASGLPTIVVIFGLVAIIGVVVRRLTRFGQSRTADSSYNALRSI
jgi:prepilin signal peptidase PulO-like enzyme (type II secretory pathway)